MTTQELGIFGENLAVCHLVNKGYTILQRNFKYNRNEIDIVAMYQNQIIMRDLD